MQKALVVFSGGQDSTTCLYLAKRSASEVIALTFDYGQSHAIEVESAYRIAKMASVELIEKECAGILESTSPLVDSNKKLESYENYDKMQEIIGDRVEKTFVPMRNALFLTIAANVASKYNCDTIVTGICNEDGANYPDCTSNFKDSIERAINYALYPSDKLWQLGRFQPKIWVYAPLLNKTKAETVRIARKMSDCWKALAWSHTSYDGQYPPTGHNHSNILRAHGFEAAGLPDPLVLRAVYEGFMDLPETDNYKNQEENGVIFDSLVLNLRPPPR